MPKFYLPAIAVHAVRAPAAGMPAVALVVAVERDAGMVAAVARVSVDSHELARALPQAKKVVVAAARVAANSHEFPHALLQAKKVVAMSVGEAKANLQAAWACVLLGRASELRNTDLQTPWS